MPKRISRLVTGRPSGFLPREINSRISGLSISKVCLSNPERGGENGLPAVVVRVFDSSLIVDGCELSVVGSQFEPEALLSVKLTEREAGCQEVL